jgi:ribosomal protein S18 acetylase RimI-like enzyme
VEYEVFLLLMDETAGYLESALTQLEITPDQFSELFRTVGHVFSVREDGELAGFYWIEQCENVLHLHGLILTQQFQGRGIGTWVLNNLETERGDRIDTIELGVHVSNAGAIRLYKRLGYATVEILDDVGFHIMRKCLSDAPGSTTIPRDSPRCTSAG